MTESSEIVFTPFFERLRPLLKDWPTPVHVVGGSIRDALLGHTIHDIDLVVKSGALSLTFRLADKLDLPAYVLDEERDVGRLILPSEHTTVDIAGYRGSTLEEDIRGRDFSINALALPVESSARSDIIDLVDGLHDLSMAQVRVIHGNSIADDPVRALRAARLAAQLDFSLTVETVAAARAVSPFIQENISPERLRDELSKLLACGAPRQGLLLAKDLNLLPYILPDIAALDGVAQSPPHQFDVFNHTLSLLHFLVQIEKLIEGATVENYWSQSVERLLSPYRRELMTHLNRPVDGGLRGRLLLYWGALLHDVGKPKTQTIEPDGRIRFIGHDEVGAALTGKILTSLKFSNQAINDVRRIVAGHMRPLFLAADSQPISRRAAYRYFKTLRESGIDVGILTLADHLATYDGIDGGQSWPALLDVVASLLNTYYTAYDRVVAPRRLMDGAEIMELLALPEGREIGRLIRLLEEAQAMGQVNSKTEAEEFILRNHQA